MYHRDHGKTYFDNFTIWRDTSIMDEWIVDGQDPEDGGVEFIWLDKDNV